MIQQTCSYIGILGTDTIPTKLWDYRQDRPGLEDREHRCHQRNALSIITITIEEVRFRRLRQCQASAL